MGVLLLNEIDGLVIHDGTYLQKLRSLNDLESVRFVMVGYSATLGSVSQAEHPLFHWTQGRSHAGKAIRLSVLGEPGARSLVAKLEEGDLSLRWRTEEEKQQGIRLLLESSYRIPAVLQRLCSRIVMALERDSRAEIRFADAEQAAKDSNAFFWQYFEDIDYDHLQTASFLPESFANKSPAWAMEIFRAAIQFFLIAIARKLYFLPADPPIQDPDLLGRTALRDFGFTVTDARQWVTESLKALLIGSEYLLAVDVFNELKLAHILSMLTLTYALEPDPNAGDRFAFMLHLYPRTLKRNLVDDPRLDAALSVKAIHMIETLLNQKD